MLARTSRLTLALTCALIFMAAYPCPAAGKPSKAAKKLNAEYQKKVANADLDKHPSRHKKIAKWCKKKKLKDREQYHKTQYAKYLYQKAVSKAGKSPNAATALKLVKLAKKLKLADEQAKAQTAWLGAEMKKRREKIADDDVASLKKLYTWLNGQSGGFEYQSQLLKDILKLDPQYGAAHRALGHIQDNGKWVDPWEVLVKKGGLKDVKARYEVHRLVEANTPKRKKKYNKNPVADLNKIVPPNFQTKLIYEFPYDRGEGKEMQFLFVPNSYTPEKSSPLIVYLHGGGAGGYKYSLFAAANNLGGIAMRAKKTPYIIIAPAARNHVKNSWNIRENMLDVIDGIIVTCERFNIDRKRIYLCGASMGGGGTARFSWVVPECFAAFSPQAGAYWNRHPVPDLTGKPFIVFHGNKDAGFRNKSLKEFLQKTRAANATVKYVPFPNAGHQLPGDKVDPQMFAFFAQHTNAFAPNLRLVRKIIEETVKEKPYP